MSQFSDIMLELKELAHDLSMSYITSFLEEEAKREVVFANQIVLSLYKNKKSLGFLSKMHRQDLDDALRTHEAKYLRMFGTIKQPQEDIKIFKSNLAEIFTILKERNVDTNLEHTELDLISERVYQIVHNAQLLFAEQAHNQQAKDTLQAQSIILSFINLDMDNQQNFLKKMLLVKEVWCVENAEEAKLESVKYKFHKDVQQHLQLQNEDNIDAAFEQIILLLTEKTPVLQDLTDGQLMHLYDRLKNYEWNCDFIVQLLHKVHEESQFRYSYNRLTDSGYDLLNRFQSYDAMMHQVEGLEFSIVESYLINNTNFLHRLIQLLAKYPDNIRALGLNKNKHLIAIFKKIESKLHHMSEQEQEGCRASFLLLKGRLGNPLDAHVQKRYIELDRFTIHTLQDRYSNLFANILKLFEPSEEKKAYLQEVFSSKLTHDFYLPNLSNSIEKLRKMAKYRLEVKEQLQQLSLVDIFLGEGQLNKIHALDFKKMTIDPEIKLASDYVRVLIREIVYVCSAFQLDALYKPLLHESNLSAIQSYLKAEIVKQIHQRTSVAKMVYSIVRGRKKEYDHLRRLKKVMHKSSKANVSKNEQNIS